MINPKAKKDSIVIDWHDVTERFVAVNDLKEKLNETLGAHLPKLASMDEFNVGYFHGRPQLKSWILTEADLQVMYSACSKEILLWCDGKSQDSSRRKRKKTVNQDEDEDEVELTTTGKRATSAKSAGAEEEEMEENIHELQSIHADNYDYGQYRLWARMIKNKQWKDFHNPPNLPMITGKVSRKCKTDVVDTLATTAVAIIKALRDPSSAAASESCVATKEAHTPHGISPAKKVELRSKYLKQLREIQNLRDEGVLTLDEFQVEKDTILQALKGFR